MKTIERLGLILISIALFAPACSASPPSSDPQTRPVILTSTSVLADLARNVAGDRVKTESLVPIGADPHAYQAAPSDVTRISKSGLLILNGLDYERFIQPLIENADGERTIVVASSGVPARDADPHLWLDPTLVVRYVENIRDGLIQFDPEGETVYRANAESYIAQLKDLDAWIKEQVAQIPADQRLLVTNHEALGYFADRYGFVVVGAVVPSFSADAAPSAAQMAALIDSIKSSGAQAIFLGEVENPALAEQIANETGVKVVDDLYLETLTAGPPAATYIDMMKHNVARIVSALTSR
jgi:ABC-type Zn uptake system ZnuABC Zn-binding protein ZnuA